MWGNRAADEPRFPDLFGLRGGLFFVMYVNTAEAPALSLTSPDFTALLRAMPEGTICDPHVPKDEMLKRLADVMWYVLESDAFQSDKSFNDCLLTMKSTIFPQFRKACFFTVEEAYEHGYDFNNICDARPYLRGDEDIDEEEDGDIDEEEYEKEFWNDSWQFGDFKGWIDVPYPKQQDFFYMENIVLQMTHDWIHNEFGDGIDYDAFCTSDKRRALAKFVLEELCKY